MRIICQRLPYMSYTYYYRNKLNITNIKTPELYLPGFDSGNEYYDQDVLVFNVLCNNPASILW